jgi:hypothetical protein
MKTTNEIDVDLNPNGIITNPGYPSFGNVNAEINLVSKFNTKVIKLYITDLYINDANEYIFLSFY